MGSAYSQIGARISLVTPRGDMGAVFKNGLSYDLCYMLDRRKGRIRSTIGLSFTSLAPRADYLIFNDLEENVDKPEKAKPHALLTISDANTVVCKMINGKIEKSYAWGAPQKRNDDHYAMVGVSAFDEVTHTWASIVVNGDDKRARIAWLKLD